MWDIYYWNKAEIIEIEIHKHMFLEYSTREGFINPQVELDQNKING